MSDPNVILMELATKWWFWAGLVGAALLAFMWDASLPRCGVCRDVLWPWGDDLHERYCGVCRTTRRFDGIGWL